MTGWPLVFLGMAALSLFVMAAVQIGLIVVLLQVARRVNGTLAEFQREIRPLIDKANRVADEATRAATLATAQVERVDRALAATAVTVDQTLGILRGALAVPSRKGAAALAGAKVALSVFRHWQGSRRRRPTRHDEDALFVG